MPISNCDDAPNGVSTINNASANAPYSDATTSQMATFKGSYELKTQAVFHPDGYIFIRRYTSNGWQGWRQVPDCWVPMMSGERNINVGSSISVDLPSRYTRVCVEGFTQGWRFSNLSQRGTVWVTIQNASGGMEYIYTEYDSATQKLTITNPSSNTTSATVTQVYGLVGIP